MQKLHWLAGSRWQQRSITSTALIFSLFAAAHAQQAPATIRLLPEDAQRGLNGAQHNFDFLPPGVADERKYQTAGFFGQKLRPYLADHPEALAQLNHYRRQKTQFLVDRIVAVGSFGVYGQQVLSGSERQYFNDVQKVALGVFATSIMATLFINRNTNSYLQRAVNAYNLGKPQSALWPRLRPAGMGLGAAPTGQPLLVLRWAVR